MLELVASGRVRPELLVGSVIALADAGDALGAMGAAPTGSGITVIRLRD